MKRSERISQILTSNDVIRNEVVNVSSYYNGEISEDKLLDISLGYPNDAFTIRTSYLGGTFYYDSLFLNGKVDRTVTPI